MQLLNALTANAERAILGTLRNLVVDPATFKRGDLQVAPSAAG